MSEKTTLGENGIYDARSLGVPKHASAGTSAHVRNVWCHYSAYPC